MNQLAFEVGQTATPEAVQFYILAPIAVLAALGILVVKKAVHAALLMAWIMITLAIFYIANGAAFLGADLNLREKIAIAPVIALIVLLGFYPKPALDLINPVAETTIAKSGFTDPAPTVGSERR